MKKILVVVDMQNDFIDGPLGTPEARAIVDNVCAKIRGGEWDWIIRTMDTHFNDLPRNNYLETQEGRKLPIEHCIQDTNGWCSNDDIRVAIQEYVAMHADETGYCRCSIQPKDTFGSIELPFKLHEFVEEHSIENIELTLVGVCTDICVISNALLLKAHYPEMKIVVDASCCAGSTPKKHCMALEVMKSCQVDVVNKPKMNNGDKVRRMNNEELAEFIKEEPYCNVECAIDSYDCYRCAINYLDKESEK